MTYDPRQISEGGNRGIDETFTRRALKGKYRVIGVDTFDGGDWVEGDFSSSAEALAHANRRGGPMTKMHVYDDNGKHIGEAGTF